MEITHISGITTLKHFLKRYVLWTGKCIIVRNTVVTGGKKSTESKVLSFVSKEKSSIFGVWVKIISIVEKRKIFYLTNVLINRLYVTRPSAGLKSYALMLLNSKP